MAVTIAEAIPLFAPFGDLEGGMDPDWSVFILDFNISASGVLMLRTPPLVADRGQTRGVSY